MTLLLILLFFCHFLADFTHLSTKEMLDAKRLGTPLYPIVKHAFVHTVLMGLVLALFGYGGSPFEFDIVDFLMMMQFGSHFLIDLLKGRLNGWFPSLQSPTNKWHWVIFGADQFMHAVVIIIMAHLAHS